MVFPLSPGFRFHPTDVELLMYYLKRKVLGRQFPFEAIAEIELYKYEPWDLRGLSCLKTKDLVWFFFCSLDKKYATGQRTNRATNLGFWKTTGKDKPIYYESRIVGMRKTLIFQRRVASRVERTDWVMYEYRLEDKKLADACISQDTFVVCQIFEKSGRGPKNGEQYGAQFKEEDYDDDGDEGNDSVTRLPLAVSSSSPGPEDGQNAVTISSTLGSGSEHDSVLEPFPQQSGSSIVTDQHPSSLEHDNLLPNVTDVDSRNLISRGRGINEKVDLVVPKESTSGFLKESTIEDADGHETFKGDDDGMSVQDLLFPMVEEECLWWSDLLHPMKADGSEDRTSDSPFVDSGGPVPMAMDSFGSNLGCREPMCVSGTQTLNAGEIGGQHAPQSLGKSFQC